MEHVGGRPYFCQFCQCWDAGIRTNREPRNYAGEILGCCSERLTYIGGRARHAVHVPPVEHSAQQPGAAAIGTIKAPGKGSNQWLKTLTDRDDLPSRLEYCLIQLPKRTRRHGNPEATPPGISPPSRPSRCGAGLQTERKTPKKRPSALP